MLPYAAALWPSTNSAPGRPGNPVYRAVGPVVPLFPPPDLPEPLAPIAAHAPLYAVLPTGYL